MTGPSVFNMRADITDLNINGSNCNVYTKAEVDAKVAGGVGLLVKGNDTDGNVENINAETLKTSTPRSTPHLTAMRRCSRLIITVLIKCKQSSLSS